MASGTIKSLASFTPDQAKELYGVDCSKIPNLETSISSKAFSKRSLIEDMYRPSMRAYYFKVKDLATTKETLKYENLELITTWKKLSFQQAEEIVYWESIFKKAVKELATTRFKSLICMMIMADMGRVEASKLPLISVASEFHKHLKTYLIREIWFSPLELAIIMINIHKKTGIQCPWFSGTSPVDLESNLKIFIGVQECFSHDFHKSRFGTKISKVSSYFLNSSGSYTIKVRIKVDWRPPRLRFTDFPKKLYTGSKCVISPMLVNFKPQTTLVKKKPLNKVKHESLDSDMVFNWNEKFQVLEGMVPPLPRRKPWMGDWSIEERAGMNRIECRILSTIVTEFPDNVQYEISIQTVIYLDVLGPMPKYSNSITNKCDQVQPLSYLNNYISRVQSDESAFLRGKNQAKDESWTKNNATLKEYGSWPIGGANMDREVRSKHETKSPFDSKPIPASWFLPPPPPSVAPIRYNDPISPIDLSGKCFAKNEKNMSNDLNSSQLSFNHLHQNNPNGMIPHPSGTIPDFYQNQLECSNRHNLQHDFLTFPRKELCVHDVHSIPFQKNYNLEFDGSQKQTNGNYETWSQMQSRSIGTACWAKNENTLLHDQSWNQTMPKQPKQEFSDWHGQIKTRPVANMMIHGWLSYDDGSMVQSKSPPDLSRHDDSQMQQNQAKFHQDNGTSQTNLHHHQPELNFVTNQLGTNNLPFLKTESLKSDRDCPTLSKPKYFPYRNLQRARECESTQLRGTYNRLDGSRDESNFVPTQQHAPPLISFIHNSSDALNSPFKSCLQANVGSKKVDRDTHSPNKMSQLQKKGCYHPDWNLGQENLSFMMNPTQACALRQKIADYPEQGNHHNQFSAFLDGAADDGTLHDIHLNPIMNHNFDNLDFSKSNDSFLVEQWKKLGKIASTPNCSPSEEEGQATNMNRSKTHGDSAEEKICDQNVPFKYALDKEGFAKKDQTMFNIPKISENVSTDGAISKHKTAFGNGFDYSRNKGSVTTNLDYTYPLVTPSAGVTRNIGAKNWDSLKDACSSVEGSLVGTVNNNSCNNHHCVGEDSIRFCVRGVSTPQNVTGCSFCRKDAQNRLGNDAASDDLATLSNCIDTGDGSGIFEHKIPFTFADYQNAGDGISSEFKRKTSLGGHDEKETRIYPHMLNEMRPSDMKSTKQVSKKMKYLNLDRQAFNVLVAPVLNNKKNMRAPSFNTLLNVRTPAQDKQENVYSFNTKSAGSCFSQSSDSSSSEHDNPSILSDEIDDDGDEKIMSGRTSKNENEDEGVCIGMNINRRKKSNNMMMTKPIRIRRTSNSSSISTCSSSSINSIDNYDRNHNTDDSKHAEGSGADGDVLNESPISRMARRIRANHEEFCARKLAEQSHHSVLGAANNPAREGGVEIPLNGICLGNGVGTNIGDSITTGNGIVNGCGCGFSGSGGDVDTHHNGNDSVLARNCSCVAGKHNQPSDRSQNTCCFSHCSTFSSTSNSVERASTQNRFKAPFGFEGVDEEDLREFEKVFIESDDCEPDFDFFGDD